MGENLADYLPRHLEDITRHSVDFTINLTEENFIRIIDVLGGLNMYFDPYSYQASLEYKRNIGEYLLFGHEVVDAMTLKDSNEPIEYINRLNIQQSVLFYLYDYLQKNQDTFRKEWLAFFSTLFDTDLSIEELTSIYNFILENHFIFMISEVPGDLILDKEKSVLLIDKETAKKSFERFEADLLDEEFPYEGIAKIEVLNGTHIQGLARRVKSFLNVKRFNVLSASNAWSQNQKISRVINRSGNSEYAYKISEILGIKKVHHVITKENGMDTTILLGENFELKY